MQTISNNPNNKSSNKKQARRFGSFFKLLIEYWDLFITFSIALVAAILAVISVTGVNNSILLSGATLLALSTLTASMLRDRTRLGNIEKLMRTIVAKKAVINADDFFRPANLDPYAPLQELLEDAREIWILGISNLKTINNYHSQLQTSLENGAIIKILMVDPVLNNPAISMQAMRSFSTRTQDVVVAHGKEAYECIENLRSLSGSSKITVQGINFLPTFGLLAINPKSEHGKICIKLYPFKVSKNKYCVFSLEADKDKSWYQFYCSQFQVIWDDSHQLDHL